MRHDPTFWIIARATGLLAVSLLTATVCAGLTLRGRPLARLRPAAVADVHRFVSLLALMAVAAHGVALVLDATVEVTPLALVVPGLVPYRPLWTGVGVAAAEAMLLIHVSFRLRGRIGVRAWRRLHFAAYGAFAAAMAHGLLAGTDSARPWARAGYLLAAAAVAGLTAWRATAAPRRRSEPAPGRTASGLPRGSSARQGRRKGAVPVAPPRPRTPYRDDPQRADGRGLPS